MRHDSAIRRLKTIEGHIRGIERMMEEETYCIDVIRQLQAVQAALRQVTVQILDEHMNACLITVVQGEDAAERERVLREVVEVFDSAART